MNPDKLKAVVARIQRKYPEFSQSQPKVRSQKAPPSVKEKYEQTYLLTFHSSVKADKSNESKSIKRWMRVVINEKGKILKITTSR